MCERGRRRPEAGEQQEHRRGRAQLSSAARDDVDGHVTGFASLLDVPTTRPEALTPPALTSTWRATAVVLTALAGSLLSGPQRSAAAYLAGGTSPGSWSPAVVAVLADDGGEAGRGPRRRLSAGPGT